MKKLSKMIVTLTVPINYTEFANELIKEGEIKSIEDMKEYFTDTACEDLATHLLCFTDIVSDLTFEIEEE